MRATARPDNTPENDDSFSGRSLSLSLAERWCFHTGRCYKGDNKSRADGRLSLRDAVLVQLDLVLSNYTRLLLNKES